MVASLVACSFLPCSTRFSKLQWQSQGHTFWTLVSQWLLIVVDLAGIIIQNYYTTCTEGIKIFLLCRFVSYAQIECSQSNTARNGVPRAISDAMKSFPSGHAQLSTHCAVFVILYVQSRIGTHFSSLWKHFLQMVFLVFALVCSLSRIVDKRHHWWDVLAGMLIGATFAYVTVSVFTCSTSYCIIVDIACCPLSIHILFKVKWNSSNFQKHLKLEHEDENTDEFDSNSRRYQEHDEQSVRHRSTTTIVE